MHYYEVASLRRGSQRDGTLTYHHDSPQEIGAIVQIPFGKQTAMGVIVSESKKPDFETKSLGEKVTESLIPEPLISSLLWMAQYYATPLNTTFSMALPKGIDKKRRKDDQAPETVSRPKKEVMLTADQKSVLESILGDFSSTHLLQGVTGSGKTQVYIELAKKMVAEKKSVIVLVPEISLTTQVLGDFQNHFDHIIVTHSGMTESQRHAAWNAMATTDKPVVVIGPRSALFSPLKNVGAVIIDECHEGTYKQDTAPRYDARRLARMLATGHQAHLVMGSATPNVIDRYLSDQKSATLRLDNQIAQPEKIEKTVVDFTNRDHFARSSILSNQLIEAMIQTKNEGMQSMVFHNRRGTATIALCQDCGWTGACPNCDVPMTLHKDDHELRCHICAHTETPPAACPDCRSADIMFKGFGTKRVAEEIEKQIPGVRVARFDADNTKEESLAKRYQEIHDGEYDVIVGTQIIAKGLDLPKLATVGVTTAESSLHLPDYASAERTFQLLTQVTGRAGRRDHASQLIIQTHHPDSPLLKTVLDNNYDAFFESEIKNRELLDYPPFTFLLQLTNSYSTRDGAQKSAEKKLADLESVSGVKVLGPTPAFYERRAGKYRWTLLVKSRTRDRLIQLAEAHTDRYWQTELDPVSLLK